MKTSSKLHTLLKSKHNLCESYLINTFMVSKGCPATTVHTPPNPPDKKYFTGFTGFFSDIFIEYSQQPHDSVHSHTPPLNDCAICRSETTDYRVQVMSALPATNQFPGIFPREGVRCNVSHKQIIQLQTIRNL